MLNSFATFFIDSLGAILMHSVNAVINYIINPLISGLCAFIVTLAEFLPQTSESVSGAPSFDDAFGTMLGYINWLIPVDAVIIAITVFASSAVSYCLLSPLLRLFKILK